jgi:hypothetical protein
MIDDIRRMFDEKEYLYAFDLDGKDVTLTIASVAQGELIGDGGKKSKKPVITFANTKKKLALNQTNKKILGAMYGFKVAGLVGKRITIYPTTTTFGPDTMDCIRIRPTVPKEKP